jgi:hypothetical protein
MAPRDTGRGSEQRADSGSTAPPPRQQPGNPRERGRDQQPRPPSADAAPAGSTRLTTDTLKRGGIGGALAFVAGYVLTAVALYLDVSLPRGGGNPTDLATRIINQFTQIGAQQILADAGGELLLGLRVIAWTFFSAQQIPLDGTASGLGQSIARRVDVLTVSGQIQEISLTTPVYYLIPVVCLAVAGLLVARRTPVTSRSDAAIVGGQVLVGYLPCAVVTAVLVDLTVDLNFFVASATLATAPVMTSVLLMTSVYAAVCGALGGLVKT